MEAVSTLQLLMRMLMLLIETDSTWFLQLLTITIWFSINQSHLITLDALDLLYIQIHRTSDTILIKWRHLKAEDIHLNILTNPMAPCNRLILHSWVPVWADEVDLLEMLQIKTLATSHDLQDQYI